MSQRFSKNHLVVASRSTERSAATERSLATIPAKSWLKNAIQTALKSSDVYHQAVAHGLVLLRWMPPIERPAAPGMPPPIPRDPGYHRLAKRWFFDRAADELSDLGAAARQHTEQLQVSLEALFSQPTALWTNVPSFLRKRDELETVEFGLEVASSGPMRDATAAAQEERTRLQVALKTVDERARREKKNLLANEEVRSDAYLQQVSVLDPDAWWGAGEVM